MSNFLAVYLLMFISFKYVDHNTNKATYKFWEFYRIKFHPFPLLYIGIKCHESRLFITNSMPSLNKKVPLFETSSFDRHKVEPHVIVSFSDREEHTSELQSRGQLV